MDLLFQSGSAVPDAAGCGKSSRGALLGDDDPRSEAGLSVFDRDGTRCKVVSAPLRPIVHDENVDVKLVAVYQKPPLLVKLEFRGDSGEEHRRKYHEQSEKRFLHRNLLLLVSEYLAENLLFFSIIQRLRNTNPPCRATPPGVVRPGGTMRWYLFPLSKGTTVPWKLRLRYRLLPCSGVTESDPAAPAVPERRRDRPPSRNCRDLRVACGMHHPDRRWLCDGG